MRFAKRSSFTEGRFFFEGFVEHNYDLVKTADCISELGPEGGAAGGQLIAEGTPEDVAQMEGSYTGQCMKEML
jgi:excinuclease ABC subunit A